MTAGFVTIAPSTPGAKDFVGFRVYGLEGLGLMEFRVGLQGLGFIGFRLSRNFGHAVFAHRKVTTTFKTSCELCANCPLQPRHRGAEVERSACAGGS